MPLIESTMMPLGTPAPAFDLPDPLSGTTVSSKDLSAGKPMLVAFICNHCPYVVHIKEGLAAFGKTWMPKGLAMVAISANDAAGYPADGPDKMAQDAERFGYPFPYLYDESQAVAAAYDAVCTPDFFLFDPSGKLVYRGQFDSSRPGNGLPVSGADLAAAVEATLAGQPVTDNQIPSIGCSIKWKP